MAEQMTVDKVKELLEGHCWEPLKEAAEEWLKAVGTDAEDAAKEKLIPMLKNGVATVDEMLEKFGAEDAKEKFGDMGEQILAYAKQLQAEGKKYCNCPACTKAKEILEELGDKLEELEEKLD